MHAEEWSGLKYWRWTHSKAPSSRDRMIADRCCGGLQSHLHNLPGAAGDCDQFPFLHLPLRPAKASVRPSHAQRCCLWQQITLRFGNLEFERAVLQKLTVQEGSYVHCENFSQFTEKVST